MHSNSAEGQDLLVRTLIPKKTGFFLDIGCCDPIFRNNTFILESIGWSGLLLDNNEKHIKSCKEIRKNSISFLCDCQKLDWELVLEQFKVPKLIDYISLDVNLANIDVIKNFPFHKYEFKIMTFETDVYKHGNLVKDQGFFILNDHKQYKLILENAINDYGQIWEDWWINEKFIHQSNFYKNMHWRKFIENLKSKNIKFL